MDDATSSPSDSVSTATATSTPTTVTATERGFAPKPRRLARGLSDLFTNQSGQARPIPPARFVDAPGEEASAEPAGPGGESSASSKAGEASAEVAAPAAPAESAPQAGSPFTAPTSVDASPVPTGFEYRFVQLVSRLDATCNLLSDARQTHVVAAQRNSRIAWSVAAILAVAAGVSLWWAGSIAAWKSGQLEYEQTRSAMIEKNLRTLTEQNAVVSSNNQTLSEQQQALARRHDQMQKLAEVTRAELETIRTSLSKANMVIDELMSKPQNP